MPLVTEIDSPNRVVIHTGTDVIGLEDIRDAMLSRSEARGFEPGMNVLWDFQDATFEAINPNTVQGFASAVARDRDRMSHRVERVAVVAPEGLSGETIHTILEQTYVIWTEAPSDAFRVFREKADALHWLDGGGPAPS